MPITLRLSLLATLALLSAGCGDSGPFAAGGHEFELSVPAGTPQGGLDAMTRIFTFRLQGIGVETYEIDMQRGRGTVRVGMTDEASLARVRRLLAQGRCHLYLAAPDRDLEPGSASPWLRKDKPLLRGSEITAVTSVPQGDASLLRLTLAAAASDRLCEELRAHEAVSSEPRRLVLAVDGRIRATRPISSASCGGDLDLEAGWTPQQASDLAVLLGNGRLPSILGVREERSLGR